jgi:alanyl-tRNA synthetase
MAADGVLPSNEGRGYILRRLLRRAVRHGKMLGRETPFIVELIPLIINQNAGAYPELREKEAHILNVLTIEEEKFFCHLGYRYGFTCHTN